MNPEPYQAAERRPIASRDNALIQRTASLMASRRISPNAISVSGIFFAAGAGAALAATPWAEGWTLRLLWLAAVAGVQLRLLANLFDGMVAIEGGTASPVGELYNEVPDRISDPLILIGAGYAVGSAPELGFTAALAAMFVAYIRAMGAAAGAGQQYYGPMAKQHRMFLVTVASLYNALAPVAWQPVHAATGWGLMGWTLVLIIAGCVLTAIRRLIMISRKLRMKS